MAGWLARLCLIGFLGVPAVIAPGPAAGQATVAIPLQLPAPSEPAEAERSPASPNPLGKLAVKLVDSSNFNSYTRPEVVGLSIPEIQDRYRQVAANNNLVITYDTPQKFVTEGGELWVLEIVVGLGRPDRVDALFTIDNAGRVVAHEKYSGGLAVELRQAAAEAVSAP